MTTKLKYAKFHTGRFKTTLLGNRQIQAGKHKGPWFYLRTLNRFNVNIIENNPQVHCHPCAGSDKSYHWEVHGVMDADTVAAPLTY